MLIIRIFNSCILILYLTNDVCYMILLFAIIATLTLQIGLTIYCFRKQNLQAVREDLRIVKFQL